MVYAPARRNKRCGGVTNIVCLSLSVSLSVCLSVCLASIGMIYSTAVLIIQQVSHCLSVCLPVSVQSFCIEFACVYIVCLDYTAR